MNGLKRLIHEVHRRSLWQVLGIYLIASWVALQVVDVLANNFGLPPWFPAFALALLVIGLPIVLATAFVQEGTGRAARPEMAPGAPAPEAVGAAPAATTVPHKLFTWRNAIGGGVLAFALWGVVATGWLLWGSRAPESAEAESANRRSIAVLPFANRSAEGGEEAAFFADGIHDDLLTQLSKIAGLKVISRTSVMQYRDTQRPIRTIGEELAVATVLEGGVQRAGDRVRVNVQLIDARTDEHMWAETYDEQLSAANIFAIQSDLARKIAGALKGTLAPDVETRLSKRPTESLEAYDLYTQARYLLNNRRGTRAELERAAMLFREAIAADPAYAAAYAGLADVLYFLWYYAHLPAAEALTQAEAAADRALGLDETLAEAHLARGLVLEAELRKSEAEREYQRALELNPGDARAHLRYSFILSDFQRHDEAIQGMRRAVELDPLSLSTRGGLASVLMTARDYDGAIAECRKTLEMHPDHLFSWYNLGISQALKGELEAGVAALEKAVQLDPESPAWRVGLAWAHARAGQRERAFELLRALPEQGTMLKEIALVHAALGDLERAFEYLNRAYTEDPGSLAELDSDPTADPLRADARYAELVKKLGPH